MDPISIFKSIYNIALKFKEAVEKVQENKERCLMIGVYVELIRSHVKLAENNVKIRHEIMRDILHNLKGTLEEALGFITECQNKLNIYKADYLSKQLDRVEKQFQMFLTLANTFILLTLPNGQVQPTPLKEDHYYSSKNEEFEWYLPCFSSCTVSQLKDIINNLSKENISQQGDEYAIYKVKLTDGTRAKVHRIEQFGVVAAEVVHDIRVRVTAKLEHINIEKMLGYMSHGGFLYQVVEDAHHGILSQYIYGNPSNEYELPWQQFSNIIEMIAKGLVYLHKHGVIHMYVHPEKISLGSKYMAKIGFFCNSETLTQSDQEGVVTSFKMKRGFAPPEYRRDGRFSIKTDVYSFGILLLEFITGRRCSPKDDGYNDLTASVWKSWGLNKIRECIHPRLIDASAESEPQIDDIERCIHIALLCVEEDPALRPTMSAVRGWLRNSNQDLPWIQKPAYITKNKLEKMDGNGGKRRDNEVVEGKRDAAAQKAERIKEKAQVKSKKAQDDRRRAKDVVEEKEDHNAQVESKKAEDRRRDEDVVEEKAQDDRRRDKDVVEEREGHNAQVKSKKAQDDRQRDKDVVEEREDHNAQVKSKKAQEDRRRDKDVVEEKEGHNAQVKSKKAQDDRRRDKDVVEEGEAHNAQAKSKKTQDDRRRDKDVVEEKEDHNAQVKSKKAEDRRRVKDVVEEKEDHNYSSKNKRKSKKAHDDREAQDDRRRDKDVVEEKEAHNYSSKNKRKSKKADDDREAQDDRRRDKDVVEEKEDHNYKFSPIIITSAPSMYNCNCNYDSNLMERRLQMFSDENPNAACVIS